MNLTDIISFIIGKDHSSPRYESGNLVENTTSDGFWYSLKVEGKEIPFASVKRKRHYLFLRRFEVEVNISKDLIPQALIALQMYKEEHISTYPVYYQAKSYLDRVKPIEDRLRELL